MLEEYDIDKLNPRQNPYAEELNKMQIIEENTRRFEELLVSVDRAGIDKLLGYIRKTDFYRAPASTRFHLACEGGLLQHSLNVYDCQLKHQRQ